MDREEQGILDSLNFLQDIYTNGYGPDLSLVLNGQASNTSAREYLPEASWQFPLTEAGSQETGLTQGSTVAGG
mgnify:CR=1 FL=1